MTGSLGEEGFSKVFRGFPQVFFFIFFFNDLF